MPGFNSPYLLLLLLLVPVLYYLFVLAQKKRRKEAIKFSSVSLVKSALGDKKKLSRVNLLFYLLLASIALMIVGFSDPHIPLEKTKEGVNVVLVLDVSGSMQATDYKPNRLQAAKGSAEILLDSLKPKDNAGIVIFESGATTAAYLSPFKDKVIEKLNSIAPKEGKTAIGDGLSLGIDMASSIPNKRKVIILLSDGVNNAGIISPQEAVTYAKTNNIQVYTVGMGSDEKAVLGYDWFGNPQYADLDEKTLQYIADETGAKYFRSVDSKTLDEVYQNIGKEIKREKEETSIGIWFFVAALIALVIQLYLRYGRYYILQ
jgi:Ca-activated chloride channel family protein